MDLRRLPGDPRDRDRFSWESLGIRPRRRVLPRPVLALLALTAVGFGLFGPAMLTRHRPRLEPLVAWRDEALWQRRLDVVQVSLLDGHSRVHELLLRRLWDLAAAHDNADADATSFAVLYVLDTWRRDGELLDRSRPELPAAGFPDTRRLLTAIRW